MNGCPGAIASSLPPPLHATGHMAVKTKQHSFTHQVYVWVHYLLWQNSHHHNQKIRVLSLWDTPSTSSMLCEVPVQSSSFCEVTSFWPPATFEHITNSCIQKTLLNERWCYYYIVIISRSTAAIIIMNLIQEKKSLCFILSFCICCITIHKLHNLF